MVSLNGMSDIWKKTFTSGNVRKVGFAAAFKLKEEANLTLLAKRMPKGVALCSSLVVAGIPHVEGVLEQAFEYWERGLELARNKSIDLLMRITCQRQIAEAVRISGLSATDCVAVLGLCMSEKEVEAILLNLSKALHEPQRKDSLLQIDDSKTKFLLQQHHLPEWVGEDHLASFLKEKSVNLIFLK